MNTRTNPTDAWESCEKGFLVGLSQQAKRTHRKRVAVRAGVVSVALFLMGGVALWTSLGSHQSLGHYPGGIACKEVREQLPNYLSGTISPDFQQRMATHLDACSYCQELMQEMQGSPTADRTPIDYLTNCSCSVCQQGHSLAVARATLTGSLAQIFP